MPRKNGRKQATRKRVYFKLDAPQANQVCLVGSFNEWDPQDRQMKQDRKGVWRTFMSLEMGTYEYRFLVDGEWKNDPGAEVVPNEYGTKNCVRVVV